MGISSSHSRPTLPENVPFNGLLYAKLQTILLCGDEHEGNNVAR